jgi:hypothetical protein
VIYFFFSFLFWICTVCLFELFICEPVCHHSDSCIPYSFLPFPPSSSMVRSQDGRVLFSCGLGPRTSLDADLMVVYIPFALETYNTFRVRLCDTLIHLEELLQLGVLLCLINASILAIASSSRARPGPLGACRSLFLLGEESKVILEQFELGALRESTLPRHCLVIYLSEFLPEKESVHKNQR